MAPGAVLMTGCGYLPLPQIGHLPSCMLSPHPKPQPHPIILLASETGNHLTNHTHIFKNSRRHPPPASLEFPCHPHPHGGRPKVLVTPSHPFQTPRLLGNCRTLEPGQLLGSEAETPRKLSRRTVAWGARG